MPQLKVLADAIWKAALPPPSRGAPGQPGRRGPIGEDGPPGEALPAGGLTGERLVKLSESGGHVGWRPRPRVSQLTADTVTVPAGGAWTDLLRGPVYVSPLRTYQVWAGIRGIADVGGDQTMQIIMRVNGYQCFDDYESTAGAVGAWASWSQQLVVAGSVLSANEGEVEAFMQIKFGTGGPVWSPRITLIDVGPGL